MLGSTPCAYPLRLLLLAVAALPPGSVAEKRGALEWSAACVRLPATGKCGIHLQMSALHFQCVSLRRIYRDSSPQFKLIESRFERCSLPSVERRLCDSNTHTDDPAGSGGTGCAGDASGGPVCTPVGLRVGT